MPVKINKIVDNPETVEPVESSADVTMDSLTNDESFPAPDEEAIAAIQAENAAKPAPAPLPGFDPKIHAVKEDGTPSLTKTGKFRMKTKQKFVSPEEKRNEETAAKSAIPEISSREAAIVTSGLIEQLSVKLISDDFIYADIERASNQNAWEKTFDHYGGVNLTPPAALALNHMAIILTRAGQPKTLSKFKKIGGWIKSKIKRKQKKHGALPSDGNDGKRKDDLGEEKSP